MDIMPARSKTCKLVFGVPLYSEVGAHGGYHVLKDQERTTEGVQACEAELWLASMLHVRQDGSSWLEGNVARSDSLFFAKFLLGIKTYMAELIHIYSQ